MESPQSFPGRFSFNPAIPLTVFFVYSEEGSSTYTYAFCVLAGLLHGEMYFYGSFTLKHFRIT